MSAPVFVRRARMEEIEISRREALRYLGCKTEAPPELEALLDACERELARFAVPAACFAETPVQIADDTVVFAFDRIQSAALAKNLAGCKRAFVFAATLGAGVDRWLLRLSKTDPAHAAAADALSSAAAEGWCNRLNAQLREAGGVRPRFSPGYGGVALSHQKALLHYLDAPRKLGITLSESYFMTPVKTVTAFVGMEEETP